MHKNPFPPNGGSPLSFPRLKPGASRGYSVSICADNFSSSLAIGHVLARMGAQIIFSPSAWAVPPDFDAEATPYGDLWIDAYSELARLYDLNVIGVSCVGPITAGPWKGHHCIGASIAMGPDGQTLARAPFGKDQVALVPVSVQLKPPIGRGTTFAEALQRRGYQGP